jgi:hypothetical protein
MCAPTIATFEVDSRHVELARTLEPDEGGWWA